MRELAEAIHTACGVALHSSCTRRTGRYIHVLQYKRCEVRADSDSTSHKGLEAMVMEFVKRPLRPKRASRGVCSMPASKAGFLK